MSLYARLAGLAAVLALLAGGGWWFYSQGKKTVQAEWTADKLLTSETARLREQAAQKSNERIDRDYQKQKAADRVAAGAVADSLRDFAAIIKPDSPASTERGTHGAGGLDRELLGHCAEALASLGQTADRLESKVVGLQSYAKNVCVSQ